MFKTDSKSSKIDNIMTHEQFDEVVSAILDGKYSWACILILEFSGYNPSSYIPRRTYTRLKGEYHRQSTTHKQPKNKLPKAKSKIS